LMIRGAHSFVCNLVDDRPPSVQYCREDVIKRQQVHALESGVVHSIPNIHCMQPKSCFGSNITPTKRLTQLSCAIAEGRKVIVFVNCIEVRA